MELTLKANQFNEQPNEKNLQSVDSFLKASAGNYFLVKKIVDCINKRQNLIYGSDVKKPSTDIEYRPSPPQENNLYEKIFGGSVGIP